MQRAGRLAVLIVKISIFLYVAGTVNQYIDNRTYNKCMISKQKYDRGQKCEEVLSQP